jgi:hypothetical protein
MARSDSARPLRGLVNVVDRRLRNTDVPIHPERQLNHQNRGGEYGCNRD